VSDAIAGARFREARTSRGEEIAPAARRAGVAERIARAIEEGRFDELPAGIYARSAIRSYAAALGLDPVAVLRECEALLPALEEPIGAMGRLRGVHPPRRPPDPPDSGEPRPGHARLSPPDWRRCAAAAVDAAAIGAILAIFMAAAALTARVRIDALNGGEVAFGVLGFVLAGIYFTFLGGLCGVTAGGRAVGLLRLSQELSPLVLREIAMRAARWAGTDVGFIWSAGLWIGQLTSRSSPEESASNHPGDRRTPVTT
jgi:hypothetical protein